jgi:Tfp pilus assembly protein PilF
MLRDFTAILEPLPWDPHWHRFRALAWRGDDTGEALTCWRKYLHDLENGGPAPGGDSRRVQALVWREIGQSVGHLEPDWDSQPVLKDLKAELEGEDDELEDELAIGAFEKSLSFDPTQRQVYDSLLRLYEDADVPERVARTLTRVVEAFPDDVSVLRRLVDHHLRRDEPESALQYLERVRTLQPLDPVLGQVEATARAALGRHLALKGQFQEARTQLTRAGELDAGLPARKALLTRQAMLELSAGQDAQAEALIEQAQAQGGEPVVLALWLAIESIRFKLPKPQQKRFQQQFKTAAARKVTSAAAGTLASTMLACLLAKIDYPGRAGHMQEVVRYLGRTTRIKYVEDDLVLACKFLDATEKEALFDKLGRRGLKLFPNSPFFLHLAAEQEIENGPWRCDLEYAHSLLSRALPLAQASQKPADQKLIPGIRETLSKLDDIREAMQSLPIPPGGMPRTPREMQRMLANMLNSFPGEDDDFFLDEPEFDDD